MITYTSKMVSFVGKYVLPSMQMGKYLLPIKLAIGRLRRGRIVVIRRVRIVGKT